MTVKKRKLSPVVQSLLGVVIALVVAAAGWFLLVSPQRSKGDTLAAEVAAVQLDISEARQAQVQVSDVEPIRVADLFRLTKAMPNDIDISGVLLELSRIADDTGITFHSIVPGATMAVESYRVQPIELRFEGDFYKLSDFLYRLRKLVAVDRGRLLATGRLFTVDRVSFAQGEKGFPAITAGLKVSAFLYGSGPVAGAPPATPPTTPTDTTATTTATTTTSTETAATTTTETTAPTPTTPAPTEAAGAP